MTESLSKLLSQLLAQTNTKHAGSHHQLLPPTIALVTNKCNTIEQTPNCRVDKTYSTLVLVIFIVARLFQSSSTHL